MDRNILDEIVRACVEDERLLEIVENIVNMNDVEREEFRIKVVRYFMDKTAEEDIQAYRFFKIVTEPGNAELILKGVREFEKNRS